MTVTKIVCDEQDHFARLYLLSIFIGWGSGFNPLFVLLSPKGVSNNLDSHFSSMDILITGLCVLICNEFYRAISLILQYGIQGSIS